MTFKALTILSSLCLVWLIPRAMGQPVEDFFHRCVTNYVFGDFKAAEAAIKEGLAANPEDPKLKRLRDLLLRNQVQPRTGGGDQQDTSRNEAAQRGSGKSPQSQDLNPTASKPQNSPDHTPEEPPQTPFDPRGEKDLSPPQSGSPGKQGLRNLPQESSDSSAVDATEAFASATVSGQMTPELARQLLEAARLDEKAWQPLPPRDPRRLNRSRRDW